MFDVIFWCIHNIYIYIQYIWLTRIYRHDMFVFDSWRPCFLAENDPAFFLEARQRWSRRSSQFNLLKWPSSFWAEDVFEWIEAISWNDMFHLNMYKHVTDIYIYICIYLYYVCIYIYMYIHLLVINVYIYIFVCSKTMFISITRCKPNIHIYIYIHMITHLCCIQALSLK